MFTSNNVVYEYDGTFDGFLCCVFESFKRKETPNKIITNDFKQTMLMQTKAIVTDLDKSSRVSKWIKSNFSSDFNYFLNSSYLTCLDNKEAYMVDLIKLAHKYGNKALSMMTNPTVNVLMRSVKHLHNESHQYKEFIRFSDNSGILACEIEPKNYVLPMITQHFCERFPNENFIIFDSSHSMALTYKPYTSEIIFVSELSLNNPCEEEIKYQDLWKMYYNAISIESRKNPKCRINHMPKRYWKHMTEFKAGKKYLID